jgi:putative intracellular protease/amidase
LSRAFVRRVSSFSRMRPGLRCAIFLSDPNLVAKLETTQKLSDVDLSLYDAVHVAGGRGATFDLFPNEVVGQALEHFWSKQKVVGAICHGAIALGNNPDRIKGRRLTGYTLERCCSTSA